MHIVAQEDRQAAREKAEAVAQKLAAMKLGQAAIVREGVDKTLSYMAFPREHWTGIRANNMLERIMREVRRRTRAWWAVGGGRELNHFGGQKGIWPALTWSATSLPGSPRCASPWAGLPPQYP